MQTQFEELSDTQWQIIEKILDDHRKRKHNLREVMNGILEILRTGTQWRNLKGYGMGWQVIYWEASPVLFPKMEGRRYFAQIERQSEQVGTKKAEES